MKRRAVNNTQSLNFLSLAVGSQFVEILYINNSMKIQTKFEIAFRHNCWDQYMLFNEEWQ
jgi:hypothetical protein